MVEYENLAKANSPFFAAYQQKFEKVMQKGWYILGQEVSQFEQAFAEYIGTKYCIGLANGLDALTLALIALDLPPKSEVIIGANAYVACILSVINAGHVPVLIEPRDDGNIDVSKIPAHLSAKTKVIMPLHLYGYPCEMQTIMDLAKKHHLHIIEDCAQAHGAEYLGRKVGTFSTISAFSFYPTKNLGALGDGGAVLTDNPLFADKIRALRNYGSHVKYYNDYLGVNSRLDEIQAAFLNIKLPYLDKINAHKKQLATIYDSALDERFIKPKKAVGLDSVYHIYAIRHPQRDKLKAFLKEKGISTEIHYPVAPYKQKALLGMFNEDYPLSDKFHATTLSLPISYFHTQEDILYVCEMMNQFREGEG
ncbi:MAG: DegT/DnrJ/EryC1/StrS family aminotransferase [Proteobacteria bacterium]|nr:DegT/DnrJ/EryC1/StrS family aminotransferase [Pseudomonadota bacterium]